MTKTLYRAVVSASVWYTLLVEAYSEEEAAAKAKAMEGECVNSSDPSEYKLEGLNEEPEEEGITE